MTDVTEFAAFSISGVNAVTWTRADKRPFQRPSADINGADASGEILMASLLTTKLRKSTRSDSLNWPLQEYRPAASSRNVAATWLAAGICMTLLAVLAL